MNDEEALGKAAYIFRRMEELADDPCRGLIDLIASQEDLPSQQAIAMIIITRIFSVSFMMAHKTGGGEGSREWLAAILSQIQHQIGLMGPEVAFNFSMKDTEPK